MLLGLHLFNLKFVKVKINMTKFLTRFCKNNFLCLFYWIRVKKHFTLLSLSSNFFSVLLQCNFCFKRIMNYWKKEVSSANSWAFNFRLVARPVMYIRKIWSVKIENWYLCYISLYIFPTRTLSFCTLPRKKHLIYRSKLQLTSFWFN